MIVDVTSDADQRSPNRWRAFLAGGPLTPEQRRWRLRRFGVLALVGLVLGLVGVLMSALLPRGSALGSVAATLGGLGGGLVVLAGIAVGADRLR
jgi:hypothetical protein